MSRFLCWKTLHPEVVKIIELWYDDIITVEFFKGRDFMINFQRLDLNNRARYEQLLRSCGERGCEYSFVNLFLWGRQQAAFAGDRLLLFSQFDRRSVYPFPLGPGPLNPVIDAIIHDAEKRGVPCCITSMTQSDCDELEQLYPGQFRFYTDRDGFDYVYAIDDLADLKGRSYQKKRNHIHRFEQAHPDYRVVPLEQHNLMEVYQMLARWYADRMDADPHADFHLEQLAMQRAFTFYTPLGLEGLVLMDGEEILAFTMGSRLNEDTFDIHFEKALDIADGAYPTINREFARYLRAKYPEVRWLNREDDLGLEGLRKAKLSYYPNRMIEKRWARRWEEQDERG